MKKYTLPKHPFPGLKIYCKKCRFDNPKCSHLDHKVFRVRIHVPGTKNDIRSRNLKSEYYEDAVSEALGFKNELKQSNYNPIDTTSKKGNDYSVVGAILKFNQYLSGNSEYAHLKKNLSEAYRDELVRYCRYFAESLKEQRNIEYFRIKDVSQKDVAKFYIKMGERFHPKSFNKCMNGLKYFFKFLIEIEEIVMKNPFERFELKDVPQTHIESLTLEEFNSIIEAIDNHLPYYVLRTGERKYVYFNWLKNAFKLFLFTGGRREEVIELKWGDLVSSENGTKLFLVENLKVNRNNKIRNKKVKTFPVFPDFNDLLIELGLNENPKPEDYVLPLDRSQNIQTIMDRVTKAFTHYSKCAKINKKVTLKHLRKTYITWLNMALGIETGLLTSQTSEVMRQYYLDPKIIGLAEKGAKELRIFGLGN